MTLERLKESLKEMQPTLQAWGGRVVSEITQALNKELGDSVSVFLKLPPKFRLKSEASALGKIARIGYENPLAEMMDLVGVRFVVLLKTDIQIIENTITSSTLWTSKLVRDITDDIEKAPYSFDYQSIHYIVCANGDIDCSGVVVPDNTPCEVQIRTLLQHAYAELVHGNIYKPTSEVPTNAKRYVARSMALMETTDELFLQTISTLKDVNSVRNAWFQALKSLYSRSVSTVNMQIDETINLIILDIYRDLISNKKIIDVEIFLTGRKFISERIRARSEEHFIYQQPVILLIYFLVKHEDFETKKRWPFESLRDELGQIYSDLGTSIGDHI